MLLDSQETRNRLSSFARRPQELVRFLADQLWLIVAKIPALLAIILPRSMRLASKKEPGELHPTAYLDGLRGYAAWIVYNYHVIPLDWRRDGFQILFRGPAMIDIFFVISGFALTYGVLGHMHDNNPARVLDSLASAIFRRYMRLHLPLMFASFITMLAIYSGVAVKAEEPSVLQPTFWGNIWFWLIDTLRSSNPFPHVISWWSKEVRVTHTAYIPQAWTIPVEFRGSMLVFVFCVAVCRMSTRKRMWTTVACSFLCFCWATPYGGLFLFGMWLADRGHLRTRQQQALTVPVTDSEPLVGTIDKEGRELKSSPETMQIASVLEQGGASSLFLLAKLTLRQQTPYILLFCLSFIPLTAPDTIAITSIGAMMLLYALEQAPVLRKPLETRFSQYLGELSFGIYIMHNTVAWTVWQRYLVRWQTVHFGPEPFHQLPGYVVLTILVFKAAELFRMVDVKCVRLTNKLRDVMFAD